MMNAQEIIAYIGAAEKKTPVKVYIKERRPVDYGSAQVFGEGASKVIFGDWRELGPILADHVDSIEDMELFSLLHNVDKLTLEIIFMKMSSKEISEKTGLSVNAIDLRIFKLKKKIKKFILLQKPIIYRRKI